MNKEALWIIASAGNTPRVVESLSKQKGGTPPHELFLNNTNSLALTYCTGIKKAVAQHYEWIIFCHDDIELECSDVFDRVKNSGFDVVGVAGTTQVKLQPPALWHIMGGGFQGSNLRGKVKHRVIGAHGQATPVT